MVRTRIVIGAVLVLLFVVSSCARSSSGDLGVRAGCTDAVAVRTMAGPEVLMAVSAYECRGRDGRLLSYREAVDHLSQAMWGSLRLPVDAFLVRVGRSADADAAPVVLPREELASRFGPGPPGVVRAVSQRESGEWIWFLLPVAFVLVGLFVLRLGRFLTRSGVAVVLFRG